MEMISRGVGASWYSGSIFVLSCWSFGGKLCKDIHTSCKSAKKRAYLKVDEVLKDWNAHVLMGFAAGSKPLCAEFQSQCRLLCSFFLAHSGAALPNSG
jgi:hypothetical protein